MHSFYCPHVLFLLQFPRHQSSTLFPYTTLFRSVRPAGDDPFDAPTNAMPVSKDKRPLRPLPGVAARPPAGGPMSMDDVKTVRSEEHTSELQSRRDLVCRLLLEKKKKRKI